MKVLFLTPWYPSERDMMAGLFVQKHADAVRAQGAEVRVIYSQTWRDTWQQWKAIRREGWMPDIVQLNVIQKQGLLALWLKRRYGIPYVIIEHFSGYLPSHNSISAHGLHTAFMRKVCAEAEVVMPVSENLMHAMQTLGFTAKRWLKTYNVVDDFFYHRSKTQKSAAPIPILYVSCFDERAKNVKGLLNAIQRVSRQRTDFTLTLVGVGIDYAEVRAYAQTLSIPAGMLRWTGELPPTQVADEFEQASFFVLSSNYENAPVVISESLATGTPIVSTKVGGIPEMVADTSGVLVPARDEKALADAITYMLDHHAEYDSAAIRQEGEKYSFAAVGRQLMAVYESVR